MCTVARVPARFWISAVIVAACMASVAGCGPGSREASAEHEQLNEQLQAAAAESNPEDPYVFFLEGREWYHKQGCQRLRRSPSQIRQALRSEAQTAGFVPCAVCQP